MIMIKSINKKNDKRGFTLVELVVVIAILAILAVIAIPRFTRQTAKAEQSARFTTARTIDSATTIAIIEKTDTENPDADDINRNLSNVIVSTEIGDKSNKDGWVVVFKATGNSEFDIYFDKEKIDYLATQADKSNAD